MRNLRLGAASLNQTPLDWAGNQARILAAIEAAREARVGLLCLPELCIPGYGCEDAFLAPATGRRSLEMLRELAPSTQGMAVALGLPLHLRGATYDAAALLVDGELLGFACKGDLAGDGVHYEPRWFHHWPRGLRTSLMLWGRERPVGDWIFDLDGVRVGFEICEEAWVPERPGAVLAERGADVILNPSASHFAFGKQAIRERLVIEGSRAFGVAYVYANLCGNDAGRIIYDGGCTIASVGQLVARGPRLAFADHSLTTAVVDVDALRMSRARLVSFRPDPEDGPDRTVRSTFSPPLCRPERPAPLSPDPEAGPHGREEAFTLAIALGLFDYLRKSGVRGWVVSLSGGADSAACTVLCALALQIAERSLGLEGLKARCPRLDQGAPDLAALTRAALSTVYQATAHSGPVTRDAARQVAEAVGAAHREWELEAIVALYRELLATDQGRPLDWKRDDLALQNIQARARAPSVWMLANIEGKLLLTTSNRSEAAVGYATMDGDTAGGLAPIAGIDKAFLRRWLRWMETVGPSGLAPLPALAAVNRQQPTAELRPPGAHQTDEDDLMPYPVLDAIERLAIRDKLDPVEVLEALRAQLPDVALPLMKGWIDRFFRLWTQNQWKRERYAPSFHVDDENLDPKTWCRFPILSAGYQVERGELAAWPEGSEGEG